MNINTTVPDVSELREIFESYSQDEQTISIQSLQKLSTDYKFTVSSSQIKHFFDTHPTIDFVEFAQFIRHQETTLKRLFRFIDKQHNYADSITINNVKKDIQQFNKDTTLHYYWSIDPIWVDIIFKGINERRSLPPDDAVTYLQFRKEALISSTPSAQRYFNLHIDIRNHKKDFDKDLVWVPGVKPEDLRKMFSDLSGGKGFIDIQTLHFIVKESKIPVSDHQIMTFFINCDINEDNKIDFFEFCHFMRSEEDAIRVLFEELDLEQTGYLTLDEIKRSFHIKYIHEHRETLNEDFSKDMRNIDDWINSVIGNIPSDDVTDDTETETETERRIYYDDFRTYAILSGARSLLNIIQSHEHYKRTEQFSTPFIYDFDDIYIPSKDEEYDDFALQFNRARHFKLNIITFLSGTLAGIVSRTATAPIDRVKLFMQLKSHGSIGSHVNNIMNEPMPIETTTLVKRPRVFAFWRGNLTNCIKMAPETAIKFTAHTILLRFLQSIGVREEGKQQYHLNFIAGAGAGAISQTMIYPLEIAKTRLALSQYGQYRNFVDCIRSIQKFEGAKSLYKGWNASVSGIIPYCAIEMGVFFTIKDKWHQRYGRDVDPDWMTLFGFGGVASVSGTCVAYPFQLVRTKLQTQGMPGNKYKYNGLVDCFKSTWRRFGIFGLYSGIVPNFAKSIPATCISYVVVEKTKSFLKSIY